MAETENTNTAETNPPAEQEKKKKKSAAKKEESIADSCLGLLLSPFTLVYRIIARTFTAISNTYTRLGKIFSFFWRISAKLFIIFLLTGIIVAGFFLGMYLRLFDLDDLNRTFSLYSWPIIGENFVKPGDPEDEKKEGTDKKDGDKQQGGDKDAQKKDAQPTKGNSAPIKVNNEEIEKQMKEAAAAEKKRVAKLARVYEGMKPDEAAKIMEEMDDRVIVSILKAMDESQASKVMAKLDPQIAARLTRALYSGSTVATPRSNPTN